MFDLMIGIDGVQRRTRRSLEGRRTGAPQRSIGFVRVSVALGLRALADRIEPAPRAAASSYAVGGEM